MSCPAEINECSSHLFQVDEQKEYGFSGKKIMARNIADDSTRSSQIVERGSL
jgi:hypothetical protein